jgi:DNA-binding response OmpR family regulator
MVGMTMGGLPEQMMAAAGTRVLLVDDNPKLCRMVREYLEPLGYQVAVAHSGGEGLAKALAGGYDAVILDVMLPGLDGFEVLRRLRAESTVPVVMLTGRGEAPDRIAGLDLGADDYVPKTYSPRELLARLRAVIRRSMTTEIQARRAPQPSLTVGALTVDPEARAAALDGQPLVLTPTEFDLLLALAKECGRVRTREQLLLEVAERDFESFDRSIDMHISSLRRKLGDDARSARWIVTVRSAGYMLLNPGAPQLP